VKTIKQIADELGVSKQAVYKRYKGRLKEQLLPYVHTVDGIVYIGEQGETLIKSDFGEPTAYSGAHTGANTDIPLDTVIGILKSDNETLKSELAVKNRQIDELSARLADTTAALVAAQQTAATAQALHAGTMKQLVDGSTDGGATANERGGATPKRGLFGIFKKNKSVD